MTDIFSEVDEDLRREQFKAAWNRYGVYVIGVAILIVLAVAGWRGWQYWQARQAAEAGDRFAAALDAADSGRAAEAANGLDTLVRDGPGGYPQLAAMRAAAAKAAGGDIPGGVAAFDKVAADTRTPPVLRDAARTRAGYLLADTAPLRDLEARLGDVAKGSGPFRHAAREILGLTAWRVGDNAAAQGYFEEIGGDPETPEALRQRSQLMIELLRGRIAPPAAAPAAAAPTAPAAPQLPAPASQ